MSINSLSGLEPGDLFTTDGQDAWEVKSLCEQPTITLRNLRTGEETGGAVGCLNVQPFIALRPEGKVPRRPNPPC